MNVRHDDDFKIALNFLGEGGTPLNNSEVKFGFIYGITRTRSIGITRKI